VLGYRLGNRESIVANFWLGIIVHDIQYTTSLSYIITSIQHTTVITMYGQYLYIRCDDYRHHYCGQ